MYRGDYKEIPAIVHDTYSASAKVLFAVKAEADVDVQNASDTNAIFTVDVLGSDVSSVTSNGDGTTTFKIKVTTDKTDTKTPGSYKAQVRYVDAAGHPTSYPPFDFELLGDYNQRA